MLNDAYTLRYLPLFYDELDNAVSHIAYELMSPDAARNLLDEVEDAILKRLQSGPESFEPVPSQKDRSTPYYRIYVKRYVIYYVVLTEHDKKIMEVRRFLHALENRAKKI